jgi:hypothetical protein
MSQTPKPKFNVGDHVELLPYNHPEFKEGHVVEIRTGVFDCYYTVQRLDGHKVELDASEIAPWPGTLVERLQSEEARRKEANDPVAFLLAEAIDALKPKSIEERLEECRKWRLSDAEVEELSH